MIRLKNLSKLYGKVIGVNDLSIELPSGAFGLVGPNGSGKTTLINLITGQLSPTLGSVQILDADPWKDRNERCSHDPQGDIPSVYNNGETGRKQDT